MKLKKVGIWLVLLVLLCASGLGSIATVWAADPPPAKPTDLHYTDLTSITANFMWKNPSDATIVGFSIERSSTQNGEYTRVPYGYVTIADPPEQFGQFTDDTLSPGTTYWYQVKAVNSSNVHSDPSNRIEVVTPIAAPETAPTGLTAKAANNSNTQINLSWTSDTSPEIIEYKIRRESSAGEIKEITVAGVTSNSYADTGLSSGVKYTYQICSHNAGGYSPYSKETPPVSAITGGGAPAAPTNFTATASGSNIVLKWNASSNATGYKIQKKSGTANYTDLATVGAGVTTYTDDAGISTGTTYTYHVGAINDATTTYTYSDEASATVIGAAPAAPTELILEVTSTTAIKLTWTDNSNNETGFEVWRRKDGGSYTLVTTSNSNTAATATYTDSGLSQGSYYYYQVRAIITASGSTTAAYSGYCSASTTIAAPSAPSGLNVYQATSTRNELTWRDNSDNETGFKIERSKDGAAYALLTTTKANVTLYTDNTVVSGSVYDYRIKATNGVGDSYENYASSGNQSGYMSAPANLILDVRSTTSIKLDWQDNSTSETGFKIERRVDNGSFSQIATVGRNITTYTDSSLAQGRSYSYRVRAYNDQENSSYSGVATASTTAPTAPSTLRANWDTNSRIRLVWQDRSDNETGFKIERSMDGEAFSQLTTVGPNETSYTDRDISSGTDYAYRVRSYNGIADSDPTNTATPTGGAPADEKRIVLTVGSSSYYVNEQRSVMDAPPIITESRTSLPIRYVAEAIGAEVAWDGTARKTTITMPGIVIELEIGKSHGYVNGIPTVIDADNPNVQPFIQPPGRIMLPLRFVTENMGCKVDYNSFTKEISIQYPAP